MVGIPHAAPRIHRGRSQGVDPCRAGAWVVRKMAIHVARILEPSALMLALAVVADLAVGDPVYRWHPVRLIGGSLTAIERVLRRIGADGYGGGIALFVILAAVWVGGVSLLLVAFDERVRAVAVALHLFVLYS